MRRVLVLVGLALAPGSASGQSDAGPVPARFHVVDRDALRVAMAPEAAKGYDLTATTNQARFHAAVILALVRAAHERDPLGPVLLIPPEPWFEAYLEVCGLERAAAPRFAELSLEYDQWRMVEHRRYRVLRSVVEGPEPELAFAVRLFWPGDDEERASYSFHDDLSVPQLEVTNHRQLSYRMLVYPDMLVFDTIDGLSGRPTTGPLSVIFDLIGEGRVVWSRQAISPSGFQLTWTRAEKGVFGREATITVRPDGVAFRGLEEGAEEELRPIEERLQRPLVARYFAIPAPPPAERLERLRRGGGH